MTANDASVIVLALGLGFIGASLQCLLWWRGSEDDPLYHGFYRAWPILLKIGAVQFLVGLVGVLVF